MATFSSQITEYLRRFQQGDHDAALFGLLEMDHSVVPELIAAFQGESDSKVRALLVKVIWQHRQQSVVSFLGDALGDSEPMVWKEAMDGLVALACPAALDILRSARSRQFSHPQDAAEFQSWLEEAVEQANRAQSEDSEHDLTQPPQ